MLWLFLLLLGCRDRMEPEVRAPATGAPAAWNRLLGEVVDARGDVRYDQLEANREALDAYVAFIGRPNATRGKQGKQPHVFWLNAFNALVLYQVLERDVESSVTEVPSLLPWPGSRFFWGTEFVVAGEPMSLWELGHERVTHTNQDYRDFGALAVGAVDGPPLRAGLFTAPESDRQLAEQFSAFVSSDRGVRFDEQGGVWFNPVFDRYGAEIELYRYGVDLCSLAAMHTTGNRQARLLEAADQGCPHGYFAFDWSLNRSREEP